LGYYGIPACTGDGYDVLRKSLSQEEIDQKRIVLPDYQVDPGDVVLLVKGAPPQLYGIDYQVSGNELTWAGLGLDGELSAGDEVTVVHQ
jgi:hypothetical protein